MERAECGEGNGRREVERRDQAPTAAESTGIRRCVKRGPPKPLPARPPGVEVLPPTLRDSYVAPPELLLIRERFNAGDYRGCVEPIEALFFARRNTFHQALLQYVVALHQLGLGMVRTPRRLLRQALAYWEPYPRWQEGVDLTSLRCHAEALLDRLPGDVSAAAPAEVRQWWVEPPRMDA